MGMMTGENEKVSFLLLMEQIRRGVVERLPKAWVEAGYCLDAPELIAAGSHERDIFGDGQDDWLPMPTTVARVSSNLNIGRQDCRITPAVPSQPTDSTENAK